MTRNQKNHDGRNASAVVHTPRLRLKAKAPQSGYVDGAWWPHTDDLLTELPDLLAVLSVRLGTIDRVLYNSGEWTISSGKLAIGDRAIRLDGYRNQPPNSIEVLGLNGSRITLLVVPPGTDPLDAHTTMMAAASVQNAATVDDLLKVNQPPWAGTEQDRWESDGGSSGKPALTAIADRTAQ